MKYLVANLRKTKLTLLVILTVGMGTACDDDCNDCLDLDAKRILVVDTAGNNLLFGSSAIFISENVSISGSDGETKPIYIDESTNTIQFFLEGGIEEYTIALSETTFEFLTFELVERKSERCCGTQTVSTKTSLNGDPIKNEALITIIK